MRKLIAVFGVAATVATTIAAPTLADAQQRRYYSNRDHRYHYANTRSSNCYSERRSSGNKGTAAGAVVGGLSGALIGGDALGAVVGAGVGAVAGHQIAKGRVRC